MKPVALVAQWLEHQTSMGRSNGASSSLGCAFLVFFSLFYILASKNCHLLLEQRLDSK